MICIYIITNILNGKQYVGKTVNHERRIKEHIQNKAKSYIGNSIQNHGVETFDFRTIEYSEEMLDFWEEWWINKLNTMYPNGYNFTSGGEGCRISDVVKKKIGDWHKGKKVSDETRKKLSEAGKCYQKTEEHRKNLSKSSKGKQKTEEHRKNISESRKGKKFPKQEEK